MRSKRLRLHATVRNGRAEDVAREPEMRAAFASATGRAVGAAPTVLELTIPFLQIGGVAIFLQRGRFEETERQATLDAALVLGAEVTDEIETRRAAAGGARHQASCHLRALSATSRRSGQTSAVYERVVLDADDENIVHAKGARRTHVE